MHRQRLRRLWHCYCAHLQYRCCYPWQKVPWLSLHRQYLLGCSENRIWRWTAVGCAAVFLFSDSIQKVIKSGYLNLFLPVLSLRNEPTRISCELPHSPAHRFCIFHRSSPSPSTLKPPSVTVKPTSCPTSSAVQRGPTWPWRCICDGSGKQLRVKRNSSHTWANK